jgi:tripartite-type tricarboxylate transporter receptor subunit TctC
MVQGFSPAALVTKNKSLGDLKKQKRITIGTAGAGSTTHLMAEEFAKELPNIEVAMIHFQNTLDAYTAVQGGHIDATFEYIGDTKARGGVTTVGVTGKRSIDGIPALKDIGFPNLADLAAVFLILTPKDTTDQQVRELQAILLSAEKSTIVQELYRRDYATKEDFLKQPGDYTEWFSQIARRYKQFTKDIVLK